VYVDERMLVPDSSTTSFKNHEEVTRAAEHTVKEQCASGKRRQPTLIST
jgi:hypothetical protein